MSTKKGKCRCCDGECNHDACCGKIEENCATNCPCHQSESIEWEKFAEKVSENFDSIYRKFPANEAAVIIRNRIKNSFPSLISQAITTALEARERVDENTSDGYHTFKELYEFRKVYNAVLFNEWAKQGKYNVHKSLKHSDGEDCFGGGWFIVTATLPSGQISNHYELKDWKLFRVDEHVKADEWDGHTAQDVVARLLSIIKH